MGIEKGTIYIIDDDDSFRLSLERLVRMFGYESKSYASVYDFMALSSYERPGVLFLDVQMPDKNGLEFQRELVQRQFPLPIVFITGQADVPTGVSAIKSGAEDFLLKPFDNDQLLGIIGKALALDAARSKASAKIEQIRRLFVTLTPKEIDVLHGVVSGKLNKQIATAMGISIKTVKIHRAHAMKKMQTSSAVELVHLLHELPEPLRHSLQCSCPYRPKVL